ncbi:uncharacterized protein BP5553_00298 [Venustampulla echinocandica]|uniref:Uncharacterized protein n=1 Tax=Venustampulla echinocandica TaxID=2656787 RepID=A0A370TXS2_9HELO|nr:uncharacterized protein BP5553_00298 [Venustampulla echinocandica]RDL40319.1 hypothetical protein BP5553_00298 [Venustampulla echinocandica]
MSSSSHSTPVKSPKPPAKAQKSGPSSTPLFTPTMQDRQARNKNPYSSSDDEDSPDEDQDDRYDSSYANTQLRRDAAIKLDNPELVMMLAQSRNESIPSTRRYLTKLMGGFITQRQLDAQAAAAAVKVPDPKPSTSRPTSTRKTI